MMKGALTRLDSQNRNAFPSMSNVTKCRPLLDMSVVTLRLFCVKTETLIYGQLLVMIHVPWHGAVNEICCVN